jgi:hypothetical protein
MKRRLTASIFREGNWFVGQCLKIDVASKGESEDEALELYFKHPSSTATPKIRPIEVDVDAEPASFI